jgi:outer membrane protein assembly factor BamE (lipoprotein component of BamABCDE complex)
MEIVNHSKLGRPQEAMKIILPLLVVLLVASCLSPARHSADVQAGRDAGDRLTVGKVQREIREGMTNAEVAEVLGSPNMVTTDEKRREVWVYDRIATESVYSTSSGGVSTLILGGTAGGSGLVGGGGGAGYSRATGASSTSQRTLTIIIKFDENHRVRDFAYRSSSF